MRFDILTIFPEMFGSAVGSSMLKRAIDSGMVEFILHDIRQYADGAHRSVDDAPYGGGAGMIMKAAPVVRTMNAVEKVGKKRVRIFLTPDGRPLSQELAKELALCDQIIMVCGHYEGVDQRVRDSVIDMEISVGDYVLTGGELPAMVVFDAVARLLPGVLGNEESKQDETFKNNRLEYPQYTRPENLDGMVVPGILLSGHHVKIKEWRERESINKTKKARPDLNCQKLLWCADKNW